jgi:hypothetical protein
VTSPRWVGATTTGTLTSAVAATTLGCTALPVALPSGTQVGEAGDDHQLGQGPVPGADLRSCGRGDHPELHVDHPNQSFPGRQGCLFYGTSGVFPGFNEHKVNDIVIEMDVDLS